MNKKKQYARLAGAALMALPLFAQAPNVNAIAIRRWYPANQTPTFNVGNHPNTVAFDGANIWVTNASDNTVTKLAANNGAVLGTFSTGNKPVGLTFDGANIWVANFDANTVT